MPNEANEFSTVGGTAPAASVWAGYFALINQCRKARELAPARLGAANGQLYAIGNTKWQADKAFRSCSEGSNGKFDAGAGWDAVTGWNSMNGKMMTGFLCPGYVSANESQKLPARLATNMSTKACSVCQKHGLHLMQAAAHSCFGKL